MSREDVRPITGEPKGDMEITRPRDDNVTARAATRTPSFFRLIRELRSQFPVERSIKSRLVSNDEDDSAQSLDSVCHETGERLSHLDITRSLNDGKQTKGVRFMPQTLAVSAVVESEVAELEYLLSSEDFDVNQLDEQGDTLLHKAAMEGEIDCLRILYKYGADVNIMNKDGWPAVHYALIKGNLSAMAYLVECGTDMEEYTALRVREYKRIQKLSKTVYKGEEIFV